MQMCLTREEAGMPKWKPSTPFIPYGKGGYTLTEPDGKTYGVYTRPLPSGTIAVVQDGKVWVKTGEIDTYAHRDTPIYRQVQAVML